MPYAITEPRRRQMHSNKILPPFPRASSASWGASHHITSNQRRQLPRHLVKVMMSMGHQHLYLHEGDITIIMAYVTELGFYVSYIDCHRVTLTDRKKVVKSADSNSKLTHAENERKRTSPEALRITKDTRTNWVGCWDWGRSDHFEWVSEDYFYHRISATQVAVASSRKKNIKLRPVFWY